MVIPFLRLDSWHKQLTQRFRCILENRTLKFKGPKLLILLLFQRQSFLFHRRFHTRQHVPQKYYKNILKLLSASERFLWLIFDKFSEKAENYTIVCLKKSSLHCKNGAKTVSHFKEVSLHCTLRAVHSFLIWCISVVNWQKHSAYVGNCFLANLASVDEPKFPKSPSRKFFLRIYCISTTEGDQSAKTCRRISDQMFYSRTKIS